jgi:hypothetical protein
MKKLVYLFATVCALSSAIVAGAQTQKGNLMVGSDISDFNLDFQKNNTTFGMTLTPKLGYFIQDNIALGGYLDINLQTNKGNTNFGYGIGAFGRYYIRDKKAELIKRSCFFVEANAGFAGQNISGTGIESTTTNGLGIGFGPGWTYFITPNIGLEALLKYDLAVGFGSSATTNSLDLHIGFQIYLPNKHTQKQLKSDLKMQKEKEDE